MNLLDWLAIEVHAHFDVQLFAQEEQMLLYFEHQLVDNPVHVLKNSLSGYILLDLLCVLTIQPPFTVNLRDVLESVV